MSLKVGLARPTLPNHRRNRRKGSLAEGVVPLFGGTRLLILESHGPNQNLFSDRIRTD